MESEVSLVRKRLWANRWNVLLPFFGGMFVTFTGGRNAGMECVALFAFMVLLGAMGCLFWRFLFAVTGARWADAYALWLERVARVALICGGGLVLFSLVTRFDLLYPWTLEQGSCRSWYLNQSGIIIRLSVCLLLLLLLAWGLDFLLKRKERTIGGMYSEGGRKYFRALSSLGLPVLFVVMAVWGVDGVMARESHWYSALWPVQVIVLSALLALCLFPVRNGMDRQNLNYGRCLLAFVLLHGYLLYSEGMLVWFGRIPEETAYFSDRVGANVLLWASFLLSCLFPLACLLFRNAKKKRWFLHMVTFSILMGVLLELLWRFSPWFERGGAFIVDVSTGRWLEALGMGVLFVISFLPFMLSKSFWEKENGNATLNERKKNE